MIFKFGFLNLYQQYICDDSNTLLQQCILPLPQKLITQSPSFAHPSQEFNKCIDKLIKYEYGLQN